MEMHSNAETTTPQQVPKLGHQRQHSIGKSMSVTTLVLNFPAPPSQSKSYNRLSRDGLSPDFEKPPIFFRLDEPLPDLEPSFDPEDQTHQRHETSLGVLNPAFANLCPRNCPKMKSREASPTGKPLEVPSKECSSGDCKDSTDVEDIVAVTSDANKLSSKAASSKLNQKRREFLNDLLNSAVNNDDQDAEELRAEEFTMKDFREKFAVAEALAKTSMMTPPAAKNRLAARKIEMELDGGDFVMYPDEDDNDYVPPRQLLLYLVRMGSFNSAPKINNPDSQDDSLEIPHGLSTSGLMQFCKMMRGENRPQLLTRYFLKPIDDKAIISNEITAGLQVLKLSAVSRVCSAPVTSANHLRIFQWNILSQCLGQNNDGFVKCPEEALTWENRKYLIVEEIVRNNPDVICLQEVDHFKFLERMLGTQNYSGLFFPKPDSPCLYIQDNNGPDGCAIFYKRDKFNLINFDTRILEVWRVQSNQVAIVANLQVKETGKEICVCTTHLKARNGALLSKLRNEQGKDLLRFVNATAQDRPVILCGDFNAEPIEPIYSTVLNYRPLGLSSAYADLSENGDLMKGKRCGDRVAICNGSQETEENIEEPLGPAELSASREPMYTTWKIREEGEVCHTIDYIFYSKKYLKVNNCLQFPTENEIGLNRTPSFQYPSDHFSLMCDLELIDNVTNNSNS